MHDDIAPKTVTDRSLIHRGHVFDVIRDTVDLGAAGIVQREYVDHPGAVAIIALNDDGQILLVRQYRHPVRAFLWEPPAGLLDIAGEPAEIGAARELYEEADLHASTWHVLTDYLTTPGCNNEAIRVFLARGLTAVPESERHQRSEEEADMHYRWVHLNDAVAEVLGGKIHNPSAVVGILAAWTAQQHGWSTLREVSAEFPFRRTVPLTAEHAVTQQ
ncbi:NUDIX domain-containing protein [Timonella sp. A28]|uniref:NUDIX domain-containing protein n=1 Tax=Timonella sp. A28 TaxID=3442640 RepID=UPI003EC00D05